MTYENQKKKKYNLEIKRRREFGTIRHPLEI